MARSRNIKPGFFTNEVLGELPPLARLLFAGLWSICDRAGRCEDRPRKIRAEVLPYDDCDCDSLLSMLHKARFIERYEVAGQRFIQVSAWDKHQNPHVKEGQSTIPAPDKSGASPVQVEDEALPLPERARLIPDSGFLIPDSLEEPSADALVGARPSSDAPSLALVETKAKKRKTVPDCPHLAILALWAEVLPSMPQHDPEQWRGSRADHLRARWRETAASKGWEHEDDGLRYFRRLFAYVGTSPFLTGKEHSKDRRPFFAELEWIVSPSPWAKLIEGKYHQEAA